MSRTGYPTIIVQTRRLAETYHRLYGDMITATGLAGAGKTELDAVNAALQTAAADKTNLPNYREQD